MHIFLHTFKVFIGTLELLLMRRDDLLQALVTRSVGGVVIIVV